MYLLYYYFFVHNVFLFVCDVQKVNSCFHFTFVNYYLFAPNAGDCYYFFAYNVRYYYSRVPLFFCKISYIEICISIERDQVQFTLMDASENSFLI